MASFFYPVITIETLQLLHSGYLFYTCVFPSNDIPIPEIYIIASISPLPSFFASQNSAQSFPKGGIYQ